MWVWCGQFDIGRSDRIRTYDPLVPNQMRYQTALRSEAGNCSRRGVRALREQLESLRKADVEAGKAAMDRF